MPISASLSDSVSPGGVGVQDADGAVFTAVLPVRPPEPVAAGAEGADAPPVSAGTDEMAVK